MNPTRTVRGGVRKRVLEACLFCRQRKIKCDNGRPTCGSCTTHRRHCVYDKDSSVTHVDDVNPVSGETRPPTTNKKRRRVLSPPSPHDTSCHSSRDQSDDAFLNTRDDQAPDEDSRRDTSNVARDRPVSRILVADGRTTYHGQTSALFDLQDGRVLLKSSKNKVPQEYVGKALLAQAAVERQMEAINFSNGSLDFDGIEPELGLHLLSLHWSRQHHSFLITYRPLFMRDMACAGTYFSKILLNAIYFGAAKFSPRLEVRKDPGDARTAGWKYRQRVKELLGASLDRSEITTIQALLIMANSLFALGNERSAAWLYSGIAFRMLIDLGMHSERSTLTGIHGLTDEDIELRRRVFWGAFVVDKIQSLYHGRLPTLQNTDASVPIEFLDLYEEYEQWQPFAHSESEQFNTTPAYSVSTFVALCKLSIVMNTVLHKLYSEKIVECSTAELSKILKETQKSLDDWREELPKHLQYEPTKSTRTFPPPHVFSLMAMYHVLIILLHRPFVADGHLQHNARSVSVNSLLTCINAATHIVKLTKAYHRAFSIRRAPYLISYATYVSATIHVRVAAQRGPSSDPHRMLSTCLAVLRENQGTNWAAKKATLIVEGLMKKLKVDVLQIEDDLEVDEAIDSSRANNPYPNTEKTHSVQSETTPVAFSPSFDIDAVIQSFAPRTVIQANEDPDHMAEYTSFPIVQEPFVARTEQHNALNYDTSTSTEQYRHHQVMPQDEQWHEQWQFVPHLPDDVLFGFDGSAIDGFDFRTDF